MKLKNAYAIAAVIGLMCLRSSAQVTISTTATNGMYLEPYNVVEDSGGNMFISDSGNNRIVRIDATNGAASVLAGTGSSGSNDGAGFAAEFFNPQGLLAVSIGGMNGLLVADSGNNLIRFVRFSDGYVTTLAGQSPVKNGTTNELGSNATFNDPVGLDQDANGNVYIADAKQNAIRVINLHDPLFGVTNLMFLDGTMFSRPNALAFVGTNQLWVADSQDNSIKLITLATPTTGSLTSYIGGNSKTATGTTDSPIGTLARFNNPSGLLWIPSVGLIISDTGNNSLRLATDSPAYGVNNYAVSTYAMSATLNEPEGLCLDPYNGAFLVADLGNNAILSLVYTAPLPHVPSGLAATVSFGATSLTWYLSLNATSYNVKRSQTNGGPYAIVGNTSGMNFIDITVVSGQTYYYVVSAVSVGGESANSSAVSVTAPPPPLNDPQGIAFDSLHNSLFVADYASNSVQRLNLGNNSTSTFQTSTAGLLNPVSVLLDANENVYVLNQGTPGHGFILKFDNSGNAYGQIVTGLNQPTAFTIDGYGTLFVAEQQGNIRAFGTGLSNLVATIPNANVSLQGIAFFDDGTIAVSDAGDQVIWTINPITKLVSRLTGQLGASGTAVGLARFASLAQPQQLLRVGGNQIVAADSGNNRLVLIQRDGTVVTNNVTYQLNSAVGDIWFGQAGDPVASGSPRFVPMVSPVGLALGNGGEIFTSETYYNDIRGLTGTGIASPTSDPGVPLPYFAAPQGLAFDSGRNYLFIADSANNSVEQLDVIKNTTTTFLSQAEGVLNPASVLLDSHNNVYVLNQNTGANGSILEFDPYGNLLATNLTGLNQPTAFTMDGNGNIFITELAGAIKILYPSGTSNTIVTLSGNVQLQGIAAFDDGVLAVSDSANQVIWTVNPATKLVSQLTGQVGTPGATLGASNLALLNQPHQLARAGNNQLLIADYGNKRLVTADRSGAITNVLVSTSSLLWLGRPSDPAAGTTVAMAGPAGVAVSASGQVFDSEPADALIRGLTGTVTAPPATPPVVTLPLFAAPQGLAFDSMDNYLFIADYTNNAIQRLNLNNNSTVTFLTSAAGILHPVSVLLDTNHNVYVLNQNAGTNGSILKFDSVGNAYGPIVTGLNQPTAFIMDGFGVLFVTEQKGSILAFGSNSSNLVASIANANVSLQGIALFDDGTIAISDAGSNVLWTVNPHTKLITQLTGQLGTNGAVGVTNFANLSQPQQLIRIGGNQIIAADSGNNRLVLIRRDGTVVTNSTIYQLNSAVGEIWFGQAGDPVASGSPRFVPMVSPVGLALGNNGEIFASETYYEDIRGLTGTGITSPISNPGVPLPYYAAPYAAPAGIALNPGGTILYVADPTKNTVSALSNNLTTVFLNSSNGLAAPVDVAVDSSDNIYVLNQGSGTNGFVLEFDRFANLLKTNATGLALPTAMTFDNSGNILVAEQAGAVQEFAAKATNSITTLATVTNAGVQLQGIALFGDGTIVLSDAGNHVLWQLDATTKAVSLFTGQLDLPGSRMGGPNDALLNQPHQLKLAGNNLLVAADSGNNRLVVITSTGDITNALDSTQANVWFGVASDPAAAGSAGFVPMVSPIGVAIAADGGVFASETYYHDIRELLGTGITQPSSGGNTGGTGTNAVVVSPPVISPNSGYYPMGQTILVQSSASQVYYTTDGTDPTTNSLPVGLTNNVGYLYWYNSTNDLTSLRLKAFANATNGSATTAGQPVGSATIGVPTDFNPDLYAGIGSTVVIPVVCNLASGQQIESYQFRLEIAPAGPVANTNTPGLTELSILPGNDFIPLVTAAQTGLTATSNVEAYSLGVTNGLTLFAVGAGSHILFHGYAVVALLEVQIPANANPGDTYAFNVLYPSATADAYNTPVPLTAMPTTTIVVTNLPYVVGDSAATLRTWYNAGTFGDGNLDNSDVNQAFYAASGLRVPYTFSDAFNAMDAFPPDSDGAVGGDGQIRFLDWVTILERSLRLDPNNWAREWTTGGSLIGFSTNLVAPHARTTPAAKTKQVAPPGPWYRAALLGADSIGHVAPNATVSVPVYAQLADGASLSGLQFRAVVTPQNDAPALTSAPQLTTAVAPLFIQSFKPGETAFGWSLDSFNFLPRSSNFLGWITFAVPTNAVAGQTYQVSLLDADGAPNATSQYYDEFETRSATVAVNAAAPPPTICSDEWKIHFFGSTTNPAAADNADPDGDGMPNWMEFLAGTDPTDTASKLQMTGAVATVGKRKTQMQLSWTTALGRVYEIQWNAHLNNPGGWNTLSTISGTGYSTNCPDPGFNSTARFYRLQLQQLP